MIMEIYLLNYVGDNYLLMYVEVIIKILLHIYHIYSSYHRITIVYKNKFVSLF